MSAIPIEHTQSLSELYGLPVLLDRRVPAGQVFLLAGRLHIGAYDWLVVQLGYHPLHTRHTAGHRELERDRRRRARQ